MLKFIPIYLILSLCNYPWIEYLKALYFILIWFELRYTYFDLYFPIKNWCCWIYLKWVLRMNLRNLWYEFWVVEIMIFMSWIYSQYFNWDKWRFLIWLLSMKFRYDFDVLNLYILGLKYMWWNYKEILISSRGHDFISISQKQRLLFWYWTSMEFEMIFWKMESLYLCQGWN